MIKNKKFLLDFAKNLQEYFTRLEFFSHAILCMCFISHQACLIKDLNSRSEILEEASELLQRHNLSRFCGAYLSFSKGRFVQLMARKPLPAIIKWKKKFEWEEKPSIQFWNESLQELSEWQSEICGLDEKQKETIEKIVKIEKQRVLRFKFRNEILTAKNKNEDQLKKIVERAEEGVNELNCLLGSHGETAIAFEEFAHLVFNLENGKQKAANFYEKAYNMNKANTIFPAANAHILMSWSKCFSDKEKALEKLAEARKLLDDYHMERHSWYERVVKSEKDLLDS